MNLLGRGPRFEPRKGCKRQSLSFHGLRDCLPGPVRTVLFFATFALQALYLLDFLLIQFDEGCIVTIGYVSLLT